MTGLAHDGRWALSPHFDAGGRSEDDVLELARVVASPQRFARLELAGHDGVGRHRVRGSELCFFVRHNTRDIGILDEVLARRYYETTGPVEHVLRRVGGPLEVVDLGANIGLFGVYLLDRFPDARITAFEPDGGNAELLRRCIEANGMGSSWRTVEACAGTEDGKVAFIDGDFCGSRIAGDGESRHTPRAPVVDVFPYLEPAHLLKMDIEGGEWPILEDPRLAELGPAAICAEYHPHLCPEPDDPRGTAMRLLERAGYEHELLFDRPDGVGMLWAWRG